MEEDYTEGLINKSKNINMSRDPDEYLKEIGFNTRLVVFVYDKSDYVEELQELKKLGVHQSSRYNFRIGIVTDKKLIEEMKESNPTFFLEVGLSVMTLRRYDGDLFKTNLSAT